MEWFLLLKLDFSLFGLVSFVNPSLFHIGLTDGSLFVLVIACFASTTLSTATHYCWLRGTVSNAVVEWLRSLVFVENLGYHLYLWCFIYFLAIMCEPLVLLHRGKTLPDVEKFKLRKKSKGSWLFSWIFLEKLEPEQSISILNILKLLYQLCFKSYILMTAAEFLACVGIWTKPFADTEPFSLWSKCSVSRTRILTDRHGLRELGPTVWLNHYRIIGSELHYGKLFVFFIIIFISFINWLIFNPFFTDLM